jgi:uracil-DNA glycosylase
MRTARSKASIKTVPAKRSAAPFIPSSGDIERLRKAAKGCTGCDLFRHATQTVFGEGPEGATIMLVGEQPGDAEDRAGHPFVGPAGKMLDKALAEAGIDRDEVYVTNAVKHFKWIARGKKRLHQKPRVIEIDACEPWLAAEIDRVHPEVIVCLGSTAARSVVGKPVRVTQNRGAALDTPFAATVMATVHPSSLLRHPDEAERLRNYKLFVADLKAALAAAKGR